MFGAWFISSVRYRSHCADNMRSGCVCKTPLWLSDQLSWIQTNKHLPGKQLSQTFWSVCMDMHVCVVVLVCFCLLHWTASSHITLQYLSLPCLNNTIGLYLICDHVSRIFTIGFYIILLSWCFCSFVCAWVSGQNYVGLSVHHGRQPSSQMNTWGTWQRC